MRFKRRESKADLRHQLAGEARMVAFLWTTVERLQDRLEEAERSEEEENPLFVWVDEGNGVTPAIPNEADLGEQPPLGEWASGTIDMILPGQEVVVSLFRREGPI